MPTSPIVTFTHTEKKTVKDSSTVINGTVTLLLNASSIGEALYSYDSGTTHGEIDCIRIYLYRRDRGYGRALFNKTISLLHNLGATYIFWNAYQIDDISLPNLVTFYNKCGGIVEKEFIDPDDGFLKIRMSYGINKK